MYHTIIPFVPNSKAEGGGLTLNKWDENRQANPWVAAQRKSGINGIRENTSYCKNLESINSNIKEMKESIYSNVSILNFFGKYIIISFVTLFSCVHLEEAAALGFKGGL